MMKIYHCQKPQVKSILPNPKEEVEGNKLVSVLDTITVKKCVFTANIQNFQPKWV